ncbi:Lamin-B2 isoform 2 [Schistosoma japonicum]|uniref:Lamin-B2 isoform 2 n=3 Tax=Schistosoma japonicum TaxID=6182 RepID=A0A4Z2DL98_SCHJA|nr:Lamin-B2 isoform 2 [Schistosoma japonicum]
MEVGGGQAQCSVIPLTVQKHSKVTLRRRLVLNLVTMSARARKQKAMESERSEASPTSFSRSSTIERSHTSSGSPRKSFSRSERSSSPLTISRSEEKDELAHLNDRLAGYIDYVRKLELDKQKLTKRIQTVTEERMSKVEEARKTYEDEITALRNLVDDLAKQKSKAELDSKQTRDELNDMKTKANKREQENRNLQRKIENLERELSKFKQDHDAYQPLLSDYHVLEKRFEEMKRDLEAETLLRTDLENKILGLKEQLDFRSRLFDEEREKLVERSLYIEEEVEGRKHAEYESRLTEELRSIRDQTASELEEYKIQMEETFENKLGQLKSSANFSAEDACRQRSELLMARKRADDLSHDLSKKIAELELLQRRVTDLEGQLSDERRDFEAQLLFQRQEVERLKEELEESFREFTDLMNTKIALDQEILMYRKMLEGEESRLNLTPASRDSPFNIHTVKRRRIDGDYDGDDSTVNLTGSSYSSSRSRFAYRVSSTARGPVEFFKEQDIHGKWIKIYNSSTEEVNLGSWELVHEADGHETRFKFSRTFSLKPGTTCTIWSQDAEGNSHNPPSDITMKNKSFHPGTEVTILLLDADGEEQTKCTVKREKVRPSVVNFDRKSGVRGHDEKCHLM